MNSLKPSKDAADGSLHLFKMPADDYSNEAFYIYVWNNEKGWAFHSEKFPVWETPEEMMYERGGFIYVGELTLPEEVTKMRLEINNLKSFIANEVNS